LFVRFELAGKCRGMLLWTEVRRPVGLPLPPLPGFVNAAATQTGNAHQPLQQARGHMVSFKLVGAVQSSPRPSTQRLRDGSVLRWGADTPVPPEVIAPGVPVSVTVVVSPVRAGHAVTVEYRVNGGPVRQAMALAVPGVNNGTTRLFRALLPGQSSGLVDFLPVLRLAGQPISPRLIESADCTGYQVGGGAAPVASLSSSAMPGAELMGRPRWAWDTRFLWTGSIGIRKEVIGALPDGLRINWYFTEGRFVAPDYEGVVFPGAGRCISACSQGARVAQPGPSTLAWAESTPSRCGSSSTSMP
jgi:hypothetical protein